MSRRSRHTAFPDGRLLPRRNRQGGISTKGVKVFSGKRLGAVSSSWEALP
jgi:hypothetical protein